MATYEVNTSELNSEHLGKFVAVVARHLKSPTLSLGRLVRIEHELHGRVDMRQTLTVAINADESTQLSGSYAEVLLADDSAELLFAVAEKAKASLTDQG